LKAGRGLAAALQTMSDSLCEETGTYWRTDIQQSLIVDLLQCRAYSYYGIILWMLKV